MANTTYFDVVNVFEATFQERVVIDSTLVKQWFDMSLQEFATEIEPLNFDNATDQFIYLDKDGNEVTNSYK